MPTKNLWLLPYQQKVLDCKTRHNLFVGGYGSGKTQTAVLRTFQDAVINKHGRVGYFTPSYDLIRLEIAPRLTSILDRFGVPYNYNKTNFLFECDGIGDIICRSFNNPEGIVGFQLSSAHVDELDTIPIKKAEIAWNKIVARTRQDNSLGYNPVYVYTTPEGLKFAYQTWVKNQGENPNYSIIRAKSTENKFLPHDYVDTLRETYSEELVKAYIDGEFCNLGGNRAYYAFDEELNKSDFTLVDADRNLIRVGMDFNIGKMAAVAGIYRDNKLDIFDEIHNAYDTRDMIYKIKEKWGTNIVIYPDASGDNRSTNSSETDIQMLKKEFQVKVHNSNPFVRDRVNVVNSSFSNAKGDRLIRVHPRCENFIEALNNQKIDDKTGQPDKTEGFDHITDAGGYLIFGLFNGKRGAKPSKYRIY